MNNEENVGTFEDLARCKLDQTIDDLETAVIVFRADKFKAANNRAYYACFHAIDAVLALEPIAFKKHKDTLGYFNKNYVSSGLFPREIGRQISRLEIIRHKSDYDTFYIAGKEDAREQIETAKNVIELVKKFMNNTEDLNSSSMF